jgi:hypothetical protein
MIPQKCKPTLGSLWVSRCSSHPTGYSSFEISKPSIRSSPWIRGAPHVGFSVIMRKINSRTRFGVCLRPIGLRVFEIGCQYKRKSARCHRTTVSGVTTMRTCLHPDQNLRSNIQKTLSNIDSLGLGCLRFTTESCWRRARFSSRRLRRARKRRKIVPGRSLQLPVMHDCFSSLLVERNAISC